MLTANGVSAFQALNSACGTCFVTVQLCDASAASEPGVQSATAGLKVQLPSVALPVLVIVSVQVRSSPAGSKCGSARDRSTQAESQMLWHIQMHMYKHERTLLLQAVAAAAAATHN
jgi:hypothetical protein